MHAFASLLLAGLVSMTNAAPHDLVSRQDLGILKYETYPHGNWSKLTCDNPAATSEGLNSLWRWNQLDCLDLIGALNNAWSEEVRAGYPHKLPYSQFVSDKMHGPPNMNCQEIEDSSCDDPSVQCQDTAFACGWMVLNSFAVIHEIRRQALDAMNAAKDGMQDKMGKFASAFCPEGHDDSKEIKDLMAIIGNVAALFTAGLTQTFTGSLAKLLAMSPTTKDAMVASAGLTVPLGMNNIPSELQGKIIQDQMSDLLGQVYAPVYQQQRDSVSKLFDGSKESTIALWDLMTLGDFIHINGKLDFSDVKSMTEKILWGSLIPKAWEFTPKYDRPLNPLFVKTGKKCGEAPPDQTWFARGQKPHEVCMDWESWYFFHAQQESVSGSSGIQKRGWLYEVPGTPELESLEYGGVSVLDVLVSSYKGYQKNGNKNGYKMDGKEVPITAENIEKGTQASINLPDGIQTAGFFSVQICDSWDRLMDHLHGDTGPGWPCF